MPIPVTCSCGASFAAGDHLAGKRVQCPKCKNPLAIPTPAAADDDDEFRMEAPVQKPAAMAASIFDQAGMEGLKEGQINCPGCEAPIAADSVLCVKCGYHLQMGKRITGAAAAKKSGGDAHSTLADEMLEKARDTIDSDKIAKDNEGQDGMPWYILAGIFIFSTSFLFMMLWLPGEQAFLAGGGTIIAVSALGFIFYNIMNIMEAFNENLTKGLLFLFPPYAMYYMFVRWDKFGPNFMGSLITIFTLLVGLGMVMMAPWMRPAADDKNAGSAVPRVERVELWVG